jgi:hypothetical protein
MRLFRAALLGATVLSCSLPALAPARSAQAEECTGENCMPKQDVEECSGQNCTLTPDDPVEKCTGQDCTPTPEK